MREPALSILIISFNTREMTLECIRSVFDQTSKTDFELIVLDNASADGSADAIETEFGGRVRLIRSEDNLGFAGGNNAAAKCAKGEFLLLLNPDTVVLDGAIDKLLAFAAARPDAGIWGGRTVFADGSLNPASCWSRQTLWSLTSQAMGFSSLFRKSSFFNPEGLGGWDREGVRQVDIVSGCFLLIRRDLWDRLDGFHPDFFMYGEEADLCLRAESFGACPMVTSEATIVHHGGASEAVRSDKLQRLLAAKCLLLERQFPKSRLGMAKSLLAAWPLTRCLAHSVLSPIRASSRRSSTVWRDVWAHRSVWLAGRFVRN
ncbi:MAG: glycosyltransferase family 2 protein [bacterium]|nr:glycosyltransferase family 2 protein [bacterium]